MGTRENVDQLIMEYIGLLIKEGAMKESELAAIEEALRQKKGHIHWKLAKRLVKEIRAQRQMLIFKGAVQAQNHFLTTQNQELLDSNNQLHRELKFKESSTPYAHLADNLY